MCGIVGYVGPRQAAEILVDGLRRMEYRGYDSAGIAVLNGCGVRVTKAAGKLSALVEVLKGGAPEGTIGLGHTRWATPYYVDVTVENVGESNVGGAPVPLWGVDATNTLLPPATFTTTFRRCPSEPMPKKFGSGKAFSTCLVFLAPEQGTLEGVSFRPNQAFDPIVWSGEIVTPTPEPKKNKKKNKKKNG
jgi:hypothetical protein